MKKFLAILMCGILLISMVACNSNEKNSNPVTPDSSETTVTPESSKDPTETTTPTTPTVPDDNGGNDNNDDDLDDNENSENTENNKNDNSDSDNVPPENDDEKTDSDESNNGNENNNKDDTNNSNTDNSENKDNTEDNNDKENSNNSENNNENNDNDNDNNNNGNNGDDDSNNNDDEVVDPNAPHAPTAIEQQILDLLNAERTKAGLAPLTYNAEIYECAVIRANEALECWSHTRPDGTKYWTVYEECGKKITNCCGENLAKTFKDPVQIVQMLMESEGHRKNILYKDFKSVCIVVLVDERGYYYMSQCFMG